jgi:hypothetical protein
LLIEPKSVENVESFFDADDSNRFRASRVLKLDECNMSELFFVFENGLPLIGLEECVLNIHYV